MEKIPKRVYTKAFKEEAAQLVLGDGLGQMEAARRLSISMKTLANWVAVARHGKPITVSSPRQPVTELEAEVSRLRRELAEMKQERDLLKKRRRTSRRTASEVRPDEHVTGAVSSDADEPCI